MLSTIEKVIHLKSVSIFAQIPDNALADVAAVVETIEVLPAQQIFKKGEIGDAMYIIISGSVKIEDEGYILNTLAESDVFGEMALLDGEPRSASVITTDNTLLLRLSKETFHELLDDHGEIARGIIQVLSQRVRGLNELQVTAT